MPFEHGEGRASEPTSDERLGIARAFFEKTLESREGDIGAAVLDIDAEHEALYFAFGYEDFLIEQGADKEGAHRMAAIQIRAHIRNNCYDDALRADTQVLWDEVLDNIATLREFGWAWSKISRAADMLEHCERTFVMSGETPVSDDPPVY
ncbi:MAG: hypothetical protein AAB971_03830 [Patescibacteria group bacterium]